LHSITLRLNDVYTTGRHRRLTPYFATSAPNLTCLFQYFRRTRVVSHNWCLRNPRK